MDVFWNHIEDVLGLLILYDARNVFEQLVGSRQYLLQSVMSDRVVLMLSLSRNLPSCTDKGNSKFQYLFFKMNIASTT